MERSFPHCHPANRHRVAAGRVERPCQEIIAGATFEQIVWARLDAMEEVLLALQDRVETLATTTAVAPSERNTHVHERSPPARAFNSRSSPPPSTSSPMLSPSPREDNNSATTMYLQHMSDLEARVAKSADPYREHSSNAERVGSISPPPPPRHTSASPPLDEVVSTPPSVAVESSFGGAGGLADAVAVARLGVDLRTVSTSLAAAREFLALR